MFPTYLSLLDGSTSCDLFASESCKISENQIWLLQEVKTSRKIKQWAVLLGIRDNLERFQDLSPGHGKGPGNEAVSGMLAV